MHGDDEHSSMFTHVFPPSTATYPGWHTHSCDPTPTCMHSASALSQSFSLNAHASTSDSHNSPDHVSAHVHTYLSTPSVHVEPFMHGDDSQSSSSTSQL
jgi:hypothetical protein